MTDQPHEVDLSLRIGPALLKALAESGVSIVIARADLVKVIHPEQETE